MSINQHTTTDISAELFQQSLKVVPGGVHSPVRSFKGLHRGPLFFKKAKGARLWDMNGRDYLDFCMSFGPLILGHRDEDVLKAIEGALENGWSYGACEPYSLELANYLVKELPFIDQIRFVNSGTEAVMTALRLARAFTKKNKILKFNGCYHGHLDSMLIQSGSGLAGTTSATSHGLTPEHLLQTLVCDLNNLDQVEALFKKQAHEIALVAIEPLPANYGLLIQQKEYLQQLRALTKQYGILLLFDEVISGFRIGMGGMTQQTGVIPDLLCYGKIIGGGFPVGAVAGPKEIMEQLAPLGNVYQAGTLSANPVAMTAGLSTLKKLNHPDQYLKLDETAKKIKKIFEDWLCQHSHPLLRNLKVLQKESLLWFYPTSATSKDSQDLPRSLADLNSQAINESFFVLFRELLDRGIYLAPNGYEVSFISLAHAQDQFLEELKQRLYEKMA